MKFAQLLEQLSRVELPNIAVGNEGSGAVDPAKVPILAMITNDGLLEMYGEMCLREGCVILEMKGHVTRYTLSSQFAESSYDPLAIDFPYIKDSIESPFKDDVLRVLEVVDQYGRHWPVNDHSAPLAVFVAQAPHVLQIAQPIDGVAIGIRYQAAHAPLSADDLQADIVLPAPLLPALRAFVAASVFRGMAIESAQATAAVHEARYHSIMARMRALDGMNTSQSRGERRFEERGWV